MNDDPEESLRESGAKRPHMAFVPTLSQENGQWKACYVNPDPPKGEEWRVKPIIGRGDSPDDALQAFDKALVDVISSAVRKNPNG